MKTHLATYMLAGLLSFALRSSPVSAHCILPTPAQQDTFNPRIALAAGPFNGVEANFPISFIKATLVNVPPGFSVINQSYLGWCVDSFVSIDPQQVNPGLIYEPVLYGSEDTAALQAAGLPSVNWDKVNYIINHKPVGANASDIQDAIWDFIGGGGPGQTLLQSGSPGFGFVAPNPAVVAAIVADANANGAGFDPGPGQLTAVLLALPGNLQPNGQTAQPIFIEVLCPPPSSPCIDGVIGGIDLGGIVNEYLFFFADGSEDANWQAASKGFVGDVLVDGLLAKERTSGTLAYAGTISTNDTTLSAWQKIVDSNPGQAFASTGNVGLVSAAKAKLIAAFAQINALPVTAGFANRLSTSLNGLNTQNGIDQTIVINITSGFQVSSKINITGDAGDIFILRWDTDSNSANGYQGIVKFQSGGAIVPHGDLLPSNFIHVAGDINASGGGSNPPAPYPQGPRLGNGTGPLINGAQDFNGGGFFTGYWLTTGDPVSRDTHSLSNAIFVGGWYTLSDKFSLTSGTSGVYVPPNCP